MILYSGLLLSIFMEYVRPDSYLPIIAVLKINTLVPISVLLFTIYHKNDISHEMLFNGYNTKWIMFFMFLLVLSVLIADVTENSYKVFKVVLGFVIWYYIIVRLVNSLDRLKWLFATLVLSHVILVLLNPDVVMNPSTRTYISGNSYLGDGNDFSLSVCIAIPMCLYLIMEQKNIFLKAFFIAMMLVLLLSVIGTQSRGATLALAAVFMYLWWKGRHKFVGVVLIAALIGVVLNYAPPVYFQRMNSISNYEEEGSAQGRIIAWRTAGRMVKKYPLTGVGTGHFAIKLGTEFKPPEYGNQNLPWLTAHSMYFLLLGELGVPGIVFLFAILIGNYFKNGKAYKLAVKSDDERNRRYASLFLNLNGSLIAFATAGAFLSVAYYPHLYLLAGVFFAARNIYRNELNKLESNNVREWHWSESRSDNTPWDEAPKKLEF